KPEALRPKYRPAVSTAPVCDKLTSSNNRLNITNNAVALSRRVDGTP
ncbi:unnamed protein product, partial [Didymodactylos carnosus]